MMIMMIMMISQKRMVRMIMMISSKKLIMMIMVSIVIMMIS